MFYLVLINGLLDSLNPCAFGVLLLYISILFTLKEVRKLILIFGAIYILAIYLTYLLIGLGILRAVHLFGVHNFFAYVSVVILILIGVSQILDYFFPGRIFSKLFICRIPKGYYETAKRGTVLSAIVLGFLVGICEFPCTGGIYLATLGILSVKTTFFKGLGYLLFYNLMFVLPLLIIWLLAINQKLWQKIRAVTGKLGRLSQLLMGIAMILLALVLLVWVL